MKNILISACLCGAACRYDGKSCSYPQVEKLKEKYNLIPVCPEVLGGLPIPRIPSERRGDRVVNASGDDVTENYKSGAFAVYDAAKKHCCEIAVLKEKSPACGTHMIYDGTFSRTLVLGRGVCAEYLMGKGIAAFSEEEIEKLI